MYRVTASSDSNNASSLCRGVRLSGYSNGEANNVLSTFSLSAVLKRATVAIRATAFAFLMAAGLPSASAAALTVTAEYAGQDVGAPTLAGRTSVITAGSAYDVTAAGRDIYGTADQFHFAYKVQSGDFDLRVRVSSLTAVNVWSKAGLMARESMDPGSREVSVLATPAARYEFQARAETGVFVQKVDSVTQVSYPNTWVRLARAGNVFTSYTSADGANWMPLGTTTLALPGSVFLGMAVTSHDESKSVVAQFRDLMIAGTTAPANPVTVDTQAPTISGVSASGVTSSNATISWDTNELADTQVEYGLTTAYGSASTFNATLVNGHSQILTGLAAKTLYHYRVKSRDAVGNLAVSGDFTSTTLVAQTTLPTQGAKAIATFESLGLYWTPPANPGAAGCTVRYRKAEESAWKDGLAMWYDARNNECRGSLVYLSPGTNYDVQFAMPGQAPVAQITANTWNETFPIAQTVNLTNGIVSQTLSITQGGTPGGYVLYTFPSGGQTVIDVANAQLNNITISASYVIVRGLTLRGAQSHAIVLLDGAHDIVLEDNDISGWGRYSYVNSAGWQIGVDWEAGAAGVFADCSATPGLGRERIIIQRNRIHHPRYGSISWDWGHSSGPQAVGFRNCGGNNVFRYNEVYSGDEQHYFNDGIGGAENFSTTGFPGPDSDIYGNIIMNSWEDGLEIEGGGRNVRVWGNYLDRTTTGVSSTANQWGPLYIFRNVYNRSRQLSQVPLDSDERLYAFKSGDGGGFGTGRRYILHNTLLQAPPPPGSIYPQGAGIGISAPNWNSPLTNTVSRNNILQIWQSGNSSISDYGTGNTSNDFDYDLYNGRIEAYKGAESHGIAGTPVYAEGNGWSSEFGGLYALAPTSPGYDRGARLPNFNDDYLGAGADMGAHEAGSPAMRFGVNAGRAVTQ